ncbi:molybdopterin-dependent oxidoreductase [Pimelobacter simplex]|uniref:Formate dehydrogenase-O, major subunit n=1 Tax=Nocardioides simplex TaxID=2045 RepID=A0A0A1DIJ1_NOCSI|nr:molybdopterin-dependent oxidoreductase [Pimelobacter simplex]AIY17114.1 Formate dehydrogenase-O, major subunit [Pimelobacter simplex]MCG8151725.1 molybdopterin-dependent oxidoreductase [Pimelobacter simplex]GEB13095.1 oxidoreductase [Pimelobacter simplex]SFM49511.1 Anaerobic selenocysteine-containing dehydrogenase [Pimelobacter simplex]
METRTGVCNLCEATCGLLLTIEPTADGERVSGVRGNPDDPLSRGHICPKGVAIGDVHADPDRLRRPVRRVGDTWVELGWDEALDLVADRLAATVNEHGEDALAIYLGNPNVHSLGSMTHGVALAQSFRTRNKFSATSVDQLPHQLVGYLLYGHQLLLPVPDIDRTSYFLVLGANPMASNGSLMTVPDFPGRLRELHARGGRMVVLDPRRTETAKVADEHHFVRPGTDAWVLLALLQVLFAEGLTRPPAYADGLDDVERLVADVTPELAEQASGVPAGEIRRIARELAAADGAAAYGRIGVSTQEFGTVCQWAVQMINLVTGNLDREGGVLLTEPAIDAIGRGLIGRGHLDRYRSRVRQAPEFGGELPVSVLREEIETPGEGQVRALLTVAGNPVLSTPDGAALDRAIQGLDFYVAVDIYVNETTQHADVILPPTTLLERDHYDLVFHLLAVRNTARFTPAVLAKGRDQRHDWEIFRDLYLRVTRRRRRKPPLKRRLVAEARMRMSPTFLIGMLLRTGRSQTTLTELRRHPEGVDLGPLRAGQLPGRLRTRTGRIDALPAIVAEDVARLRERALPRDGELLLIGRRHQRDCNSWMHNTDRLTRGKARHQLLMHPADLASRGLSDSAVVTVRSRVGEVRVEVRATDDVMPGVVSLPHGYGHGRAGARLGVAAGVAGVSINDLTDPERLDVSGNAALSGVPVTVS